MDMPVDLLLGLVAFAAVMCFTPGPNNTMLMASGLNFGFARSLPHVLGVSLGFAGMVVAVGVGLGRVFEAVPELYQLLRIASIAYLLWLAWSIARTDNTGDGAATGEPMTFLGAALFQWINPKAWVIALGAATTYVMTGAYAASLAIMAVVFCLTGFASSAAWAGFGSFLQRLIANRQVVRRINVAMALLLVVSLVPTLREMMR